MAGKKSNSYFEAFVELVNYSIDAADMLNDIISDFNPELIDGKIKEMHDIEHRADLRKHEIMNKLAKEFITPIEREDIIQLLTEIDNVTDSIEDVLIKMYMFCISSVRPEAREFSSLLIRCCDALKRMMIEFPNYKKSTVLHQLIIEINDLEEEGDKLYTNGIRNLYLNSKDPVELMTWTETFERFEKSCDAVEHAANVVESVVMKNS
ncbi:MAG: DUF47 domain-containing protein [Clostridiaceae bacterium]